MTTLTRKDSGTTVEVGANDSVAIRLPEIPVTGFAWTIEESPQTVLSLQQVNYSSQPHATVGAGGLRTFIFIAQATGTAELRFKLWRNWEGDRSVTDRFSAIVRVLSASLPVASPGVCEP